MKSKKIYASPEIDIISFSFENILVDGATDDPEFKIRQSNPDNLASGGADVDWE